MPRSRSSITAAGVRVGARGDDEARRAPSVIASKWLIHTTSLDRLVGEQQRRAVDAQHGAAVLARAGLGDLAAEITRDELRAVTDAEQRNAGVVDRGIDRRRAVDVHRRRTAREDDRLRLAREHLGDRHRARDDLAVDVRLADPARDQLRVLRPEVDDENEVVLIRSCGYDLRPSSPVRLGDRASDLRMLTGPCRRPATAGATCPRSAARARPSLRPSGIPSPSRSRSWPSTCAARRRG